MYIHWVTTSTPSSSPFHILTPPHPHPHSSTSSSSSLHTLTRPHPHPSTSSPSTSSPSTSSPLHTLPHPHPHLSQCTLQLSQEVIISQGCSLIVQVIHREPEQNGALTYQLTNTDGSCTSPASQTHFHKRGESGELTLLDWNSRSRNWISKHPL